MERKNMWAEYTPEQLGELNRLCESYKKYLDLSKTERECVKVCINLAEANGFTNLEDAVAEGRQLKPGDKVYAQYMGKTMALFTIGSEPLENGMNILGAHIDSPRLDVKQNPLYEDTQMAYLDTHYYGGIKKYQWVTVPLAIHGVVAKTDGSVVDFVLGEDEDDPVFVVTDLLNHISEKQQEKKGSVVIEGEDLDVLVGSRPDTSPTEKDLVRSTILKYLKEKFGMEERDFISAELEVVPAGKARDCGFDRSMILAYAHDDKVCAFPSLFALFGTENPRRTCCCFLVDKEEVSSNGATGANSRFFEDTVAEVVALCQGNDALKVRRTLHNSALLSNDVSATYDPLYADAFEKNNSAFFGTGLVLNKFTGRNGKKGSNDANAEYIAQLRKIFEDNGVGYQTAEMGKIDLGGGSTIAFIMANYGMRVMDAGVSLLSMHAPFEVASKSDIYELYRGCKAFYRDMR